MGSEQRAKGAKWVDVTLNRVANIVAGSDVR